MKSLDDIYKTQTRFAPFFNSPKKRLKYMELVVKHMMILAKTGAKIERIVESGEEAIGWLTPHETEFAVDDIQSVYNSSASDKAEKFILEYTCADTLEQAGEDLWNISEVHSILTDCFKNNEY